MAFTSFCGLLTTYYYRCIFTTMSPTNVEAHHYDRYGRPKTTFHTRDTIEGTVDSDTSRQVVLYTTSEHHERSVYLQVFNLEIARKFS